MMTSVRLPKDIKARLKRLSDKTNTTQSDYVRKAVIIFLKTQEDRLLEIAGASNLSDVEKKVAINEIDLAKKSGLMPSARKKSKRAITKKTH